MNPMKIWSITDVGLVRKDNQDAYAAAFYEPTGHTLAVVCDGMGGAAGGQLASRVAADTFMEELEQVLCPEMTPEQLREASSWAVSLANKAVQATAQVTEHCHNMGTTLVSAVSCPKGAVICNVGDSRAYHISKNGIERITKDHSVVESMVDRGDITAEEARRHPNRNLITRALGPNMSFECDGYICPMQPEDFLLLCTDGLVDTVSDQEMLFEVIHGDGPEQALERLMSIAKSNGAPDNVTAVLLQRV